MGGKDSPPPQCVSTSPMQSSKCSSPRSSAGQFGRESSPIEYVAKSKASVNVDMHIQYPHASSRQPIQRTTSTESKQSRSDGTYSPIRAYMECIEPQTLKCALVGDSGVGKTSMLMSYTTDKFPEEHAPTIYDKFSSKFAIILVVTIYFLKPLELCVHALQLSTLSNVLYMHIPPPQLQYQFMGKE